MSTFLQLCSRLRQEAGISGSGPSSVTGQTGEMKRVVDWVSAAYEAIQSAHANWEFLRNDFTFPTIANTVAYLPSSVSLPEHADWIETGMTIYETSVADEQRIDFVPWDEFRANYQFGTVLTGRPTIASVKPDRSIALYPTPDDAYTVRGEYYKRAQTMTANGDEPLFPARFHLAIVWRALMLYGAQESAAELYAHGKTEYDKVMRSLEANQLPEIAFAGALA